MDLSLTDQMIDDILTSRFIWKIKTLENMQEIEILDNHKIFTKALLGVFILIGIKKGVHKFVSSSGIEMNQR